MSVFVKAAVEALKAFPLVNARIDGGDVVHQHFYDIGVAVSTEKGLMVPVIRGADQLGFADIEKEIGGAGEEGPRRQDRASPDLRGRHVHHHQRRHLRLDDEHADPEPAAGGDPRACTPSRSAPVVVNDQIVIRPMMYLALSYDHRLIDGREAVQFLVRIKECVENPERHAVRNLSYWLLAVGY